MKFWSEKQLVLKFGHSEKATKICNNLPLDLTFTNVENFYLLKIHLNLFEIPNQVLKFEYLI